jgi:6-phosphofructokinase 1
MEALQLPINAEMNNKLRITLWEEDSMRIGIITSGGDAPGMNAAIRAITRCALDRGIEVVGIHEGWQGVVDGGAKFEPFNWRSVGGILQLGGTVIGTARCQAFFTVEGRRQAARNLINAGIDGLAVIGGDGSLTGALKLYREWPEHLKALATEGVISAEQAQNPPSFRIVGLPGSIDNDQYGTDMSIGADTALNTIVEAVDKLKSTADSHQRTFVVEVMGRRCGYLALMGAVATGADWVLIPEEELDARWHFRMVEALRRGRAAGRRHDVVIFAEGARHADGLPIKAEEITEILRTRLGVEARVTVLGHVQRGGSPTAFDRILASRLGEAAVDYLAGPDPTPVMIGLVNNQPQATPLAEVVAKSQQVNTEMEQGNFQQALQLRGRSFLDSLELLKTLTRAEPKQELTVRGRIALLTGGPDAPGMNAILRTALRIAMNEGQDAIGVRYGFGGLAAGEVWDLGWMDVQNWINLGGSELGAIRHELTEAEIGQIAQQIKKWDIRGFIAVGGLSTYKQVAKLVAARPRYRELCIPTICVPATVDNNLPGTEICIGADTALNNIVDAVDKIKYTAGAAHRAFIIEVMGRRCGYLALAAGIATGAEMEILPEDNATIETLLHDIQTLRAGFRQGKKLGIVILAENSFPYYDTQFVHRVMEAEANAAFEVRESILGHLQRGGVPTAFDRVQGSRLGAHAARHILADIAVNRADVNVIGILQRGVVITPWEEAVVQMDWENERRKDEAFLQWRKLADTLAKPGPQGTDGR